MRARAETSQLSGKPQSRTPWPPTGSRRLWVFVVLHALWWTLPTFGGHVRTVSQKLHNPGYKGGLTVWAGLITEGHLLVDSD